MVSCEPVRDVDARRRTAELPLPPKVAHAVGLALRGWILRTRGPLGSSRRRKPCGSTVPATRVDRTPASWPLAVATDTARTVASPPGPRTPGGGRRRSKCPSQPSAAVSPRQRRSTDAGVPSLGGLRPRPCQLPGLRRCTPSRRRHRRAQHRPRPRKLCRSPGGTEASTNRRVVEALDPRPTGRWGDTAGALTATPSPLTNGYDRRPQPRRVGGLRQLHRRGHRAGRSHRPGRRQGISPSERSVAGPAIPSTSRPRSRW